MKLENLILVDENTGLQFIDPAGYFYFRDALEGQEITKEHLDLMANHDVVRYVGDLIEYIDQVIYAVEGYETGEKTQYNEEAYPKSVYVYILNKYTLQVGIACTCSIKGLDFWSKCNKNLEDLYQLQDGSSRYPSLDKLLKRSREIIYEYNGTKEVIKND